MTRFLKGSRHSGFWFGERRRALNSVQWDALGTRPASRPVAWRVRPAAPSPRCVGCAQGPPRAFVCACARESRRTRESWRATWPPRGPHPGPRRDAQGAARAHVSVHSGNLRSQLNRGEPRFFTQAARCALRRARGSAGPRFLPSLRGGAEVRADRDVVRSGSRRQPRVVSSGH